MPTLPRRKRQAPASPPNVRLRPTTSGPDPSRPPEENRAISVPYRPEAPPTNNAGALYAEHGIDATSSPNDEQLRVSQDRQHRSRDDPSRCPTRQRGPRSAPSDSYPSSHDPTQRATAGSAHVRDSEPAMERPSSTTAAPAPTGQLFAVRASTGDGGGQPPWHPRGSCPATEHGRHEAGRAHTARPKDRPVPSCGQAETTRDQHARTPRTTDTRPPIRGVSPFAFLPGWIAAMPSQEPRDKATDLAPHRPCQRHVRVVVGGRKHAARRNADGDRATRLPVTVRTNPVGSLRTPVQVTAPRASHSGIID